MASQDLTHRATQQEQHDPVPATDPQSPEVKGKKPGKVMRGLRSLTIGVAFPLTLILLDIFFFGSATKGYRTLEKPFYFPPLWAIHLATLSAAILLGVSAWMIWADGGFHRRPAALGLYLGQLLIILLWYPAVFGVAAVRLGLALCGALFGVIFACSTVFSKMNPLAGDLVKPCFLWVLLLAAFNVRLVYH